MRKRALPVLVVTLLTAVVWLFAEVESLGDERLNARVSFEPVGEPPSLLVEAVGFDGAVEIEFRGSRGALQRVQSVLDRPLPLRPGDSAVPDTGGLHVVSLMNALGAHPDLIESGATIESVRPQSVEIRVAEIVGHELPILPDLRGLLTEGEVQVQPPSALVRVPRALIPSLEDATVIARVPTDAIEAGAEPGPRTITTALVLPRALAGLPGVEMLTARATVSFSLRSTIESRVYPAVPVQLLLSPAEASTWSVVVDQGQQLIEVELTGPNEALERLDRIEARLVAVLALSEIELSRGLTQKEVGLALLRDDVFVELPRGVTVASALPIVRFRSARLADEGVEE